MPPPNATFMLVQTTAGAGGDNGSRGERLMTSASKRVLLRDTGDCGAKSRAKSLTSRQLCHERFILVLDLLLEDLLLSSLLPFLTAGRLLFCCSSGSLCFPGCRFTSCTRGLLGRIGAAGIRGQMASSKNHGP